MDDEIELKLLVGSDAKKLLKQGFIDKFETAYPISSSQLFNSYYDTPDKRLQLMKMACRVRGKDGKFEQTIKTAGDNAGGLSRRPEYNVQIEGNKPDLSLFQEVEWPADVNIAELQEDLVCLFDTQFDRDTYMIELMIEPNSGNAAEQQVAKIECVFDCGSIETARHQDPICEIELELKSGKAPQLLEIAKQLHQVLPFRLGTQSKAQRGYRLVDGVRLERQRLSEAMIIGEDQTTEQVFMSVLRSVLLHWQHCEQHYLEEHKLRELYLILDTMAFLQSTLKRFGTHWQCEPLSKLAEQCEQVQARWRWAQWVEGLRELRSKKGAFRKKLFSHEPLQRQIRATLNTTLETHEPEALLFEKDYVAIQLEVLSLLVNKPWCHNAFDTAERMNDVAPSWVAQTREYLETFLSSERFASVSAIMEAKTALKEMEFLSVFLAQSLMTADESSVNWRNVLDGIIDLETLLVLENLLGKSDLDDCESLLNWCKKKQLSTLALMNESQQAL